MSKAHNGKEALQKLESSFASQSPTSTSCGAGIHRTVQLVITDNHMPFISGIELGHVITEQWKYKPKAVWQLQAS